jgi:hypothetical protein
VAFSKTPSQHDRNAKSSRPFDLTKLGFYFLSIPHRLDEPNCNRSLGSEQQLFWNGTSIVHACVGAGTAPRVCCQCLERKQIPFACDQTQEQMQHTNKTNHARGPDPVPDNAQESYR